jgi:hypothetical protein
MRDTEAAFPTDKLVSTRSPKLSCQSEGCNDLIASQLLNAATIRRHDKFVVPAAWRIVLAIHIAGEVAATVANASPRCCGPLRTQAALSQQPTRSQCPRQLRPDIDKTVTGVHASAVATGPQTDILEPILIRRKVCLSKLKLSGSHSPPGVRSRAQAPASSTPCRGFLQQEA